MEEPLYELLAPYLEDSSSSGHRTPRLSDPVTRKYISRLTTLSLDNLTSSEPQSLAQSTHSTLLSIQALSSRSSKAVIASADHLGSLHDTLPALANDVARIQSEVGRLDSAALTFSEKYSRSAENGVLDRRKRSLLLARNVDRLSDILDLPTLLASAISSSSVQGASGTTNYTAALDLHSHIRRLHLMYPDSALLHAIYDQAEDAMRDMTSNLIMSLRGQGIKLAAAMRTVGWLRRIAPKLDGRSAAYKTSTGEGSLGALFLVCRLANLMSMLEALEPLQELADRETQTRLSNQGRSTSSSAWSGGQQTERYLKRYIEIFRDQSFAMISMFKSIFPATETTLGDDLGIPFKSLNLKTAVPERTRDEDDPLQPLPSALATFPLHLVDLLRGTLQQYLPNVRDKSSRESLLTQVLYCAGSLGRLGGDFSMMLATLPDEGDKLDDGDSVVEDEWVSVMKKHRILAGRLEQLASTVGGQGKGAMTASSALSPKPTVADVRS